MLLTDEQTRMTNVFDWSTGHGIFALLEGHDVPWLNYADSQVLDFSYFGVYSGLKRCQGYILKNLDANGHITDAARASIVDALYSRYRRKWNDLWTAFVNQYTPFTNIDETEQLQGTDGYNESGNDSEMRNLSGATHKSGSRSLTSAGRDNITDSGENVRTRTESSSDEATQRGSATESALSNQTITKGGAESTSATTATADNGQSKTYGLDIATSVPTSETSAQNSTTSNSVTSFDNRSDTTSQNQSTATTDETNAERRQNAASTDVEKLGQSRLNERSDVSTETFNDIADSRTEQEAKAGSRNVTHDGAHQHTIHRSGFRTDSIARLIREYISLWQTDYFKIVFNDIDSYLTLAVY